MGVEFQGEAVGSLGHGCAWLVVHVGQTGQSPGQEWETNKGNEDLIPTEGVQGFGSSEMSGGQEN